MVDVAERGGVPGGRVPLTYDALRAVLRRANDHLGANWTMHDLRHTCALRMTRAEGLSLRDVQTVLGHAHLSTTLRSYRTIVDEHLVPQLGSERLSKLRTRTVQVGDGRGGGDAAVWWLPPPAPALIRGPGAAVERDVGKLPSLFRLR